MIHKFLKKAAAAVIDHRQMFEDYGLRVYLPNEGRQREIYEAVRGKTMIGALGILGNLDAIDYLVANRIQGCVVECGVWKGGSMAAMLHRLSDHNDHSRDIFLFDTFAGMTAPTDLDKRGRINVLEKFQQSQREGHNEWCYSPLEEVKQTVSTTRYPGEKIHYVQGDVLKTLPATSVPGIALLRLDTDWYESTKAELEYLYQKVVPGGVVVVDDYGAWEGARQAVDEYFQQASHRPLMFRIDQTRRMFVKPSA